MRKNCTNYAALYKDGSYVERDTLEDVVNLSPFAILKIEWVRDHTTSYGNTYDYYRYKIINKEGKATSIKIGNFEIVGIGTDSGMDINNSGMSIKILETNEEVIREYYSRQSYLSHFKEDIFPFLNKLNELGSWNNYLRDKKNQELEKEVNSLKIEITKLNEKVNELKSENETLKAKLPEEK